jgi:ribosomal protein S28E/S33
MTIYAFTYAAISRTVEVAGATGMAGGADSVRAMI